MGCFSPYLLHAPATGDRPGAWSVPSAARDGRSARTGVARGTCCRVSVRGGGHVHRQDGAHELFAAGGDGLEVGAAHGGEVGRVGGHRAARDEVGRRRGQTVVLHAEVGQREAVDASAGGPFVQAGAGGVLGFAVDGGEGAVQTSGHEVRCLQGEFAQSRVARDDEGHVVDVLGVVR